MVQRDFIDTQREKLAELLSRVKCPKPGVYDIEIAEVLEIGTYMVQPEVAVVRDTENRIGAIPERGNLVSRYDVKKGMILRVTVGKKNIKNVLVIKGSRINRLLFIFFGGMVM